jgi:pilus assembly protein Flp/PilA
MKVLHRVARGDEGASAVEYGLLVVGIAAVVVAVVFALGTLTRNNYSTTCTNWNTAAHTTGGC